MCGDVVVTKKYTADYRMELSMDAKGRIREKPVYCGAYYRFEQPNESVRKSTVILVLALLAAAATVLIPMFIKNECVRQFYAFLPQAFALIPLYMFAASLLRIFSAKDEVIREHKDKIVCRLRNASVFLMVVSVLSAAAAIAFLIIDTPVTKDYVMIVINFLRLPFAGLLLALRKRFEVTEIDTPKISE